MNSKKRPRNESTPLENKKKVRHDSPDMQDTSHDLPDMQDTTIPDPIVSRSASPEGDFENKIDDIPDPTEVPEASRSPSPRQDFENKIINEQPNSMFASIKLMEASHEGIDETGCRVYQIEDSKPLVLANVWQYYSSFGSKNELYELTFGLESHTENLPSNGNRDVNPYRKVIPLGKKTGGEWSSELLKIGPISFSLLPGDDMSLDIIADRNYNPYLKVYESCSGIFTKHDHWFPIKFVRGPPIAREEYVPTKPHLENILIPEEETSQFLKCGYSIPENAEKVLKQFFNRIAVPDGCTYPIEHEYNQLALMLEIRPEDISNWFVLQNGHRGWESERLVNSSRLDCSIEIKSFFDPSQVAARFLKDEFQENNKYPHDVCHEVGKPILDKLLSEYFYDKPPTSQKRLQEVVAKYALETKAKTADIIDWLKYKSIEDYGIFNYLENLRSLRLGRRADQVTASRHLNTSTDWIERRARDLEFKKSNLSFDDTIQEDMNFYGESPEQFARNVRQLMQVVIGYGSPTIEHRERLSVQTKISPDTISNFQTLCKKCKDHRLSFHDYLLSTGTVKWSTATIVWFYEQYFDIRFHTP